MESDNSEQLLTELINRTTDMIQVFKAVRNEHGKIVDFLCIFNNTAAAKVFGDSTGKSSTTLSPWMFEDDSFDNFKKIVESGESSQSSRQFIHANFNGWFHLSSVKQNDGVAITIKDITQNIKTEEQTRKNKESLEAILDGSVNFIQAFKAIRDEAGQIIDFTWIFTNHIWVKHYGDVIGKSLLQQNPAVVETGLFDQFIRVTETGETLFQERHYSHEQFQDQWFYQTLVKLEDGFVMTTEDITDRKKTEIEIHRLKDQILQHSEDKYQTIFNTIEEGLSMLELIYDHSGKPIDIRWVETNPAFERITGLKSVAGKLHGEFFSSNDHWLDIYDNMLKDGKPKYIEHYDKISKKWYRINASRVGGPESRIFANAVEDITDLKQREQRQAYLLRLSDVLRSISDPSHIENAVTKEALAFFQSDRCYYCSIEEGSAIICQDAFRSDLRSLSGTYLLNEFKLYYVVLETGLPFAADDIYNTEFIDKDLVSVLSSTEIQAFVNIPIVKSGKVVGIFSLAQSQARKWKEEEIALAAETAERTWFALEQAKAEKAIQKSEEQLRLFISASLNLVYKMSADWTQMYTLTGKNFLANNNGTAWNWMEKYLPEDERPMLWEAINQALNKKTIFELEHRVLQPEGTVGWVLSRAVPVLDKNGEVSEWLGASIDITSRKSVEISLKEFSERLEREVMDRTAELEESRDQLQSILDTTLLQMSVLKAVRDTKGDIYNFEIISVNKELERITGRTDLVGKLYASEYPGVKEVGLINLMIETVETGHPHQMEYYYAHEGFANWFSCMFVKLDDGVVATNMDITARKQAEDDRFKNYVLLQQSEDIALLGNWDFDLLKKSFTWSDGMYRLFDLEKGLEIQPEIYLEYATENGREVAEKVVKHIISGDSDFEETLEINISGKVKLLHIKAAVVINNTGHAERVLGVDMDISAIYAAEEKIRRMEAEQQLEIFRVSLTTLEEERHRISESLHNGIGQILYGIKLNMTGLQQELPPEEFKENMSYVGKLLTEAIKEARRISHELMPTTLEQFGLESAILDICSQLSDSTVFKCTFNGLSQGMEKYLELAVYRTTQELMTNVVKHAEASECKVNISIDQKEIHIHVSDNGQGMEASKTSLPGIGLASIRSKIKLLKGDVRIDSLANRGTNIEVIIPKAQVITNR